jgi:hypothetical protein
MLLWRRYKAAIRPGAGIKSQFRYEHQLKGKLLRYIRNYCGAIELAGPNSLRYRPVSTIFEALGGKRKQPRSIAIFGFGANLDRLQPQQPFRWGKQGRLQHLLLRTQGLNGRQLTT